MIAGAPVVRWDTGARSAGTRRRPGPATLLSMRQLGRFRLLTRLASGSMGELFAGVEAGAPTVKAVQRIRPELASDLRFSRLLLTEANAAQRLKHPAAVAADFATREGEELGVVAPLVRGTSLAAVLKAVRLGRLALPQRWVCSIGAELAEALDAAHALPWFPGAPAPMVHGALAPRSVLLADDGRVSLTGFGVGRARASVGPSAARLPYAAPERWSGRELVPRTDTYALGLTLYEALSGRRPFHRPTEEETRAAIAEANVPPLHAGVLEVRLEVADLLQSMVAPRVEARPTDLGEVAAVLRAAAEEPPDRIRAAIAAFLRAHFSEEREQIERRIELGLRALGGEGAGSTEWTADLRDVPTSPPPSDERLGRYVLVEELGMSGHRRRYRARDPNLGREVVVHLLDPEIGRDDRLDWDGWVRFFKREARFAARVEHRRLPLLLDAGRHGVRFFAVHRFLPGATLADRLEREGPLEPETLTPLAADWAEALAALHRAGLLHADLGPENLLCDPALGGSVVDLSRASPIGGPMHPLAEGVAPENRAGHPYDVRSEQYAFGKVLARALSTPEGNSVIASVVRRLGADDPALRYLDFEAVAAELRGHVRLGLGEETRAYQELSVRAVGLGPPRPAAATAKAVAGRIGVPEDEASALTAAADLLLTAGLSAESQQAQAILPESVRAAVASLSAGPLDATAAVAWAATSYHALALPPDGRGAMAPRQVLQRLEREARGRGLPPGVLPALLNHLRSRHPGLGLGSRDDRVLVVGGGAHWVSALATEGFEVVAAKGAEEAWAELDAGGFLGAVLGADAEDPELRRRLHVLAEAGGLRFATVAAEAPEGAVRAAVRGWRRP